MSLTVDIDEFSLDQLKAEVAERERRKAAGVCTYCARDRFTIQGRIPCKFPKRHSGEQF